MLSPRAIALVRGLIVDLLDDRKRVFTTVTERIPFEAASRGSEGLGDARYELTRSACEEEASARVEQMWLGVRRVIIAGALEAQPDMLVETRSVIESFRHEALADLEDRLNEVTIRPLRSVREPLHVLGDVWDRTMNRYALQAELELTSIRHSSQVRPDPGNPVFNIYGAVGAVQAGTQSTANVQQNFGASMGDLRNALQSLRSALAAEDMDMRRREEVLALISTSETEASEQEPKLFKLYGALSGIAMAIQTLPNLAPAYKVLKAAATGIGLHLP